MVKPKTLTQQREEFAVITEEARRLMDGKFIIKPAQAVWSILFGIQVLTNHIAVMLSELRKGKADGARSQTPGSRHRT